MSRLIGYTVWEIRRRICWKSQSFLLLIPFNAPLGCFPATVWMIALSRHKTIECPGANTPVAIHVADSMDLASFGSTLLTLKKSYAKIDTILYHKSRKGSSKVIQNNRFCHQWKAHRPMCDFLWPHRFGHLRQRKGRNSPNLPTLTVGRQMTRE